jgi:AcrR family transcriptional regulator
MSPQAADPVVRERLIEAAARVLGEEGPSGLSTRKLAAEVGTSTMAVYTHFGGLPGLVHAVVDEGFTRLAQHMADIPHSDDPLIDLAMLATAYRSNALDNPHLYAVMFGSVPLGGFRPTREEDGRDTFDALQAAVQRAIDANVIDPGDAEAIARQLWSSLHGYVMLELAGFMRAEEGAVDDVLWPMMANLIRSLGARGRETEAETEVVKKALTGRQISRSSSARRSR